MLKLKYCLLALAVFMTAGLVLNGNVYADCEPDEQRTTTTGAVFTCDTSHLKLGEAWRDPDGLIWGDIVKNEDGSVRHMVQSSEYMKAIGRPLPEGTLGAEEYCESIGARLPLGDEFIRLVKYMGARFGTWLGYRAQVLPNLSGYVFWSSSVDRDNTGFTFYFGKVDGSIVNSPLDSINLFRCVVSR